MYKLNPPSIYQRLGFIAVLYVMLLSNITPAFSGVQVADVIISKTDITSSVEGHDLDSNMIGFTDQDTALFISVEDISTSKGYLFQRNIKTEKITNQLRLSAAIDPYSLVLSPNGKVSLSYENLSDITAKLQETHKIKVLNNKDMSVLKTIDVGSGNNISGMHFINNSNDHIIVQIISAIPFKKDDVIYGHDRFVLISIKTGKIERAISYAHARGVNKLLFSSGGKYLTCLFPSDDEADQLGILDVLDPKTGKILWHIEGSAKQPIGDYFFFISPTKFVSSSRIYDIAIRKSSPLIPANDPRLYCLGNVPLKTDYAFFMTKNGLELWNIMTKKSLRRWPTLNERGFIRMSPNLKVMSFQRDKNIEFWKFDPTWLK